ncbi:MAG: glycoside hydrolase family 130 protein [Chloroflexota bacterium]
MSTISQMPYQLERVGVVMELDPNDPNEVWGVLNPASARQGQNLYLYPRVVAEGNYSRIGIAQVRFGNDGSPVAVTRLGYALEPEEEYERSERSSGGVEDPRITYVEPLRTWVMAYTAVSRLGPRIALATSTDLFHWNRLGLLRYHGASAMFDHFGNKDGALFPEVVLDPHGKPALAILHRPTYLVHRPDGTILLEVPYDVQEERESIWIGYISLERAQADIMHLTSIYQTELLATPMYPWESLKIGGGTPPIRTEAGWLIFYHGVSGSASLDPAIPKQVCYSAGAMLLDFERPTTILYRSRQPVLRPEESDERFGIVPNVVFPTGVDRPQPGILDVYYGMADSRIGVARTRPLESVPTAD